MRNNKHDCVPTTYGIQPDKYSWTANGNIKEVMLQQILNIELEKLYLFKKIRHSMPGYGDNDFDTEEPVNAYDIKLVDKKLKQYDDFIERLLIKIKLLQNCYNCEHGDDNGVCYSSDTHKCTWEFKKKLHKIPGISPIIKDK